MSLIFKKYALHYNEKYGLAVAFLSVTGVPFHDWRQYADVGMSRNEVLQLYTEHVEKPKREALRLAILTGPYIASLERPILVVDIDEVPEEYKDKDKKMELMKTFVREGYQVVHTPRGFHLTVFLDKSEKLPYILRIFREDVEGKKVSIGEGGSLFPHTWSTVPSLRPLEGDRWFRYGFITKDGERIVKYEDYIKNIMNIEPAVMKLSDVVEDISFLLSANVSFFEPYEASASAAPKIAEDRSALTGKRPVYPDFETFYASAHNTPLPLCVAWVLYHYAKETGDELLRSYIAASYEFDFERKVPHGMRFLISAAAGLFLAHVIDWITYDEIMSVLEPAIEDWPHDDGYPLSRRLSYLFLRDSKGHVYPRYGGLGSLSPAQVFNCTDICVYSRMCRGRNPWRPYERLIKRRHVAKLIYSGEDEIEGL